MIVRDNEDLAPYTTFGVHAACKLLLTVESEEDLRQALKMYPFAKVLGGGSNILVVNDLNEPVIRMAMHGRHARNADDGSVHVEVAAGENWHGFVTWCIDNDLGGLENLALIPGTVGAAPMQNIGAYGIEQDRCFVELKAMERTTGIVHTFDRAACRFGYRTSVFKEELADHYVITSVTYRLTRPPHTIHASYKDVVDELHEVDEPTIRDVYTAVVHIRTRKLPDPNEVGNAGSFFKNAVVSRETYLSLADKHNDVPHYNVDTDHVKIPSAWLIDQCGWKGFREGAVGVHERQPLVLVNFGDAEGSAVQELAERVAVSVKDRFGIELVREVNIW